MNVQQEENEAVATASSSGKLVYKVGIEFTMMPPVCSGAKGNERSDNDIADNYASILETIMNRKRFKVHECGRDGRAVECPTIPLSSWGDVKKAYDVICGSMVDIGLVPSVEGSIGGGNHMHVGPMPARTMVNLFRDLQNRPYLAWVFNEPDDNITAKSFTEFLEEMTPKLREQAKLISKSGIDPTLFMDNSSISDEGKNALTFYGLLESFVLEWLPDDKSHALRYASDQKTLEFRFFETPLNWQECESQLMFVEAYIRWIEKKHTKDAVEVKIEKASQMAAYTEEQARTEFTAFIAELGLPLERYEVWLKENLPVRFERGERT